MKKFKKNKYDVKSDSERNKVSEPIVSYQIEPISYVINEGIYTQISVQDLMLFGIYSVLKKNETCTFERLVAECFYLFPRVFGLKRYPQWPDTLKFDRATRSLREKGLVIGGIGGKDSPGEFKLTQLGISLAMNTEMNLKDYPSKPNNHKKSSLTVRSIDDKLIEYLKDNQIIKKFKDNPENFSITESDFRSLLRCTLETPKRVLKQNLEYFVNISRSYNEESLLSFLIYCDYLFFSKGV